MRAESAPVRVLGKCPAFEAVVMAARVVVMRSPIPNLRNNDNCNYRLLFRGYQATLPRAWVVDNGILRWYAKPPHLP